jgi:hypothetical protein
VVLSAAVITDDLLLIEADFVNYEYSLEIRFWIVPDFITTAVPVSTVTSAAKWEHILEH